MKGEKETRELLKSMLEDHNNEDRRNLKMSDKPILNVLSYYLVGVDVRQWYSCDDWRLKYDADARYFSNFTENKHDALRGDTMISFWTPYKMALRWATGNTGYTRMAKNHESIMTQISKIESDEETPEKNVSERFDKFAQLCYSPGNFLYLPDRGMNPSRFRHKNAIMEDRIDKTLYECFPDGLLCEFFGKNEKEQDEELNKWIDREQLAILFKDKRIKRDYLIPLKYFGQSSPKTVAELDAKDWDMNYYDMAADNVLYDYIDKVVELIEYRNDNLDESKRVDSHQDKVRHIDGIELCAKGR